MVNVFSLFCYRLPFRKKQVPSFEKKKLNSFGNWIAIESWSKKAANIFSAIISPWRERLYQYPLICLKLTQLLWSRDVNSLQKDRLCLRTSDFKSSQAFILNVFYSFKITIIFVWQLAHLYLCVMEAKAQIHVKYLKDNWNNCRENIIFLIVSFHISAYGNYPRPLQFFQRLN